MNKWWWVAPFDSRWSKEEVYARSQLGIVAVFVFVLLMIPQFELLPRSWNTPIVALITVVPIAFVSALASRFICGELWPDLIKAGDDKAAARQAREQLEE